MSNLSKPAPAFCAGRFARPALQFVHRSMLKLAPLDSDPIELTRRLCMMVITLIISSPVQATHDPATGNYAHSDYYFQTYADTNAACQASLSGWPTASCGAGTGFAKCVGKVGDGFLNTKTGDQFLHCTAACPDHASRTPPGAPCACDAGYEFDAAGTSCVAKTVCTAVTKLDDITDPIAKKYEDGTYSSKNPDIEHLTQETQAGLACIKQKVIATNCNRTPQATSGYRPAAYQKHIYDVYTKWQKIKDNSTPECAEVKAAIKKQFDAHSQFVREPGKTSNHSQTDAQGNPAGAAVDISFVPDNVLISADAIACQCNMYRPLINMPDPTKNDPVHYQPRTCPR